MCERARVTFMCVSVNVAYCSMLRHCCRPPSPHFLHMCVLPHTHFCVGKKVAKMNKETIMMENTKATVDYATEVQEVKFRRRCGSQIQIGFRYKIRETVY